MMPPEFSALLELVERAGPLWALLFALWRKWVVLGWVYEECGKRIEKLELENERLAERCDRQTALMFKNTELAEGFAELVRRIPQR
jgi:hypothetical protein